MNYKELEEVIYPQTVSDRVNDWENIMKRHSNNHSLKQAVVIIRLLELQNKELQDGIDNILGELSRGYPYS